MFSAQGLNVSKTSPWVPFLKLSHVNTYAAHECCQTGNQTQHNIRFTTQATTRATLQWSKLGPQLSKSFDLKVYLEWHIILPQL
jgi:hypothetical protein